MDEPRAARAGATDDAGVRSQVGRILMSEEAVYGLILVSGMIVVSNGVAGTSLNALLTVVVTVIVFFAAHVYAGTIARLASEENIDLGASITAAARHSVGMLLVSVIPAALLLLGVIHLLDDEAAIWFALLADTVVLGVLGWIAVSRWTPRFWPRVASALITAAFGLAITALKVLIH